MNKKSTPRGSKITNICCRGYPYEPIKKEVSKKENALEKRPDIQTKSLEENRRKPEIQAPEQKNLIEEKTEDDSRSSGRKNKKAKHDIDDDEKQKKYNSTSTVDFNSTTFLKEISRARTFGFMSDIDYMKKNKLALGGSEKNAVVIGEDEILNEDGLRSSQELVKHKILDVIGDLYLLQYNIVAEFEGYKSGHSLNNLLLNRLLELPDAWEVISSDGDAPEIRYIEPIIDPSSG